ncbi:MAG TPA: hypothetical protein VGS27_33400 [Candidatus Sulfotelmatobacter sp.]|nr:hypothetical protein [Candidatus Sulfotelmatobacter sp.]
MSGDAGTPSKPIASSSQTEDWRALAEQASKEQDPQKLLKLVQDLCDNLDHRDGNRKRSA